jgi:hypothetical protein
MYTVVSVIVLIFDVVFRALLYVRGKLFLFLGKNCLHMNMIGTVKSFVQISLQPW